MDNKIPRRNFFRVVFDKLLEESLSASFIRIISLFTTIIGVLKGIDYLGFDVHAFLAQKHVSSLLLIISIFLTIELVLAKRKLETSNDDHKPFMYYLERELQALSNNSTF